VSGGPFSLLWHSLRRARTLVLTTGVVLACFQVVLVEVAGSIQTGGGFEQLTALLPQFARELLGPSLVSFMSFAGIVCVGYFHLAVMTSLMAVSMALATVPVSEIESGFIDLVLARPLARQWIITRSIAVVTLSIALMLAMILTGTWAGLEMLAPKGSQWPSARLLLSLAANLGMLMLCWSGVAMAIGAGARRRAVAAGWAGLLALAAFLLDYVGRLWKPAEAVAWLSPFRYYNPFDLVMGTALPWKNPAVLGGIALAGFATAYVVFARRDISH
jgi:ABC-2 type transport system permease protein